MKALSGFLFLSALVFAEASGPADIKLAAGLAELTMSTKGAVRDNTQNDTVAIQWGKRLKEATLVPGAMPKNIVDKLDEEMGEIFKSGASSETNSKTSPLLIAKILDCFRNLNDLNTYTYSELHKVAREEGAHKFLSASVAFNHHKTFGRFLPFLISIYKGSYYNEEFWAVHEKDWRVVKLGAKLDVIREANNPRFVEDFLNNKLPHVTTPHDLSDDQMLDLIAEYDLLDLFNHFENLGLFTFEQLRKRLDKLVEFGSPKLLKAFHGATGEDLNLWRYPFSGKLLKDKEILGFLKKQGYQYMPVEEILAAACTRGYVDILEGLYKIDEKLIPDDLSLGVAASRGQWSVLKWVIDNNSSVDKMVLLFNIILHGHFEIFQLFKENYNSTFDSGSVIPTMPDGSCTGEEKPVLQILANRAAGCGQARVIEWISDKFEILPEKLKLSEATVRILKLFQSKKPEIFDAVLLERTKNMSSIKWLWSNRHRLFTGDVFTDEIKRTLANAYFDGKDLQWFYSVWGIVPKSIWRDISIEDLEFLKKGIIEENVDISEVAKRAVIEGDSEKLEYLIKNHPSCLDTGLFETALRYGHAEIADILTKHFGTPIPDIHSSTHATASWEALIRAFDRGERIPDLVRLNVREYCVSYPISEFIEEAIENDRSEIVKWAIDEGYVTADQFVEYLDYAIEDDSFKVVELLIETFGDAQIPNDYHMECWEKGRIRVLKVILPKLAKSDIEMLLNLKVDVEKYHLRVAVEEEYKKRT